REPDAGARHRDAQRTELPGRRDRRLDLRGVGHVRLGERGAELAGERLAARFIAIDDQDLGTTRGQPARRRRAEARGATRDECDRSVELHGGDLSRSRPRMQLVRTEPGQLPAQRALRAPGAHTLSHGVPRNVYSPRSLKITAEFTSVSRNTRSVRFSPLTHVIVSLLFSLLRTSRRSPLLVENTSPALSLATSVSGIGFIAPLRPTNTRYPLPP